MHKRDYEHDYDKNTGGVDTHVAVDTKIKQAGSSITMPMRKDSLPPRAYGPKPPHPAERLSTRKVRMLPITTGAKKHRRRNPGLAINLGCNRLYTLLNNAKSSVPLNL